MTILDLFASCAKYFYGRNQSKCKHSFRSIVVLKHIFQTDEIYFNGIVQFSELHETDKCKIDQAMQNLSRKDCV